MSNLVNYVRVERISSKSWVTIDLPHEMSVSQAQAYIYDHYKGWRFSHAMVDFPTEDMLFVDEYEDEIEDDCEYTLVDYDDNFDDYEAIDEYFADEEMDDAEMFVYEDENGNEVFDAEAYLEYLDFLDEEE